MNILRKISLTIIISVTAIVAMAQDVIVNVAPIQEILPPQVLLYLSSPEKYFTVTLTNTSSVNQDVYLGFAIEQTMPRTGLAVVTPANRQPAKPFTVTPGNSYTLTSTELRHIFDHVPANEVTAPAGLFENYANGSFGLLPEGEYQIHVTAYRWNPELRTPIAVSNPLGGMAHFTVCYSAQAPRFLAPMMSMQPFGGLGGPGAAASLELSNPLFTWTEPVVNCNPRAKNYRYSLRIVQLLEGQAADFAIEHNPVFYQVNNLIMPQCLIPGMKLREMRTDCEYVAQVTATTNNTNPSMLDYVMIENNGRSDLKRFKLMNGLMEPVVPQVEKNNGEQISEDQQEDEEEDVDDSDDSSDDEEEETEGSTAEDNEVSKAVEDWDIEFGHELEEEIDTTKLYNFQNPELMSPIFVDDGSPRKQYAGDDVKVEWVKMRFMGGEGLQRDTLKFQYHVEFFDGGKYENRSQIFAEEPLLSYTTTELEQEVTWAEMSKKFTPGKIVLIRVRPECLNNKDDIAYFNDTINTVDYAIVEHVSKEYFTCSATTKIDNTEPTTLTAEQLRGKRVALGEYTLLIDQISDSKEGKGFDGKGHVEWQPLGMKVMLSVTFDTLQINKDLICYGGLAQTVTSRKYTSAEAVSAIFSDAGLDDLVSNSTIPDAGKLSASGKEGIAKALADKASIGRYYETIKTHHLDDWTKEGMSDDVEMPIGLPSVVKNNSPVNIQITTFRFAPTWATMDLVGSFQVDGCSWTENDVLMLGAPRLCISPNQILPESGTLALLADFNVKDPSSGYSMTFNAPKDLLHPDNGCYVSWHDNKFERLGVDIDMKIPHLKKEVDGKLTDEMPTVKLHADIGDDWHDWLVPNISMDPFQHEDLPGFTFTAKNIVYDHSVERNSDSMGVFPVGYDNSWLNEGLNIWEGLYIKEVSVAFPSSLQVGDDKDDSRFKLTVSNLFFDESGFSFDAGLDNVFKAKTGKLGGWAFSLDKAGLRVVQDDFSKCYFSGKMQVPLTDGEIAYNCNIYKQTKGKTTEGFAYIFTTQQVSDKLTLDLFLADVAFNKDQTYFIVESVPVNGEQVTNVELMMGGVMSIAGSTKKSLQEKINSTPLKIKIPDVHFAGLRFANFADPYQESLFDDVNKLRKGSQTAKLEGHRFVDDKQYSFANDKFFINRGAWSVASLEKKLGDFTFTIKDYSFSMDGEVAKLYIEGGIGLLDNKIVALGGITLNAKVTGIKEAASLDFSKLGFDVLAPTFNKLSLSADFSGMQLEGTLDIKAPDETDPSRGYGGSIMIKLPQNLFTIEAKGGFYNYEDAERFRWGYFEMMMGGSALTCPPIEFTEVTGGFYFNCIRKSEGKGATAKNGVIGIYAKVGIGMAGAPETLNGSGEFCISYDTDHFSTIKLTVDAHVAASKENLDNGIVNAKIMILYENQPQDRFVQITLTADASADVSKDVYQQLAGKALASLNGIIPDPLKDFDRKSDTSMANEEQGKDCKTNSEGESMKAKAKVGFSITLDMRFELEMKNKAGQKAFYTKERTRANCKWHVWLGKPNRSERCSITFIDFQLGEKTSPVALWAQLYANGYLCFGNELPKNPSGGYLPEIPSDIKEFLDGKDVNNKKQSLSSTAQYRRDQAVSALLSKSKGGLMFGCEIGGGFGCNAVIAYADVSAKMGFDVILAKIAEDAQCGGVKGTPGAKGWYGVGQAYGLFKGEVGLMINLWIFNGKIPLVDAGIGALVQVGLPNPTWVYGKMRAQCKLFNGLIKFNKSIEMKAGKVCTPESGNPLDDIEIFGDVNPEYESKQEGWKTKDNDIDPYLIPRFTTNMNMDKVMTLCSESNDDSNDVKERKFIFKLNNTKLERFANANASVAMSTEYLTHKTVDKENWTVNISALEPEAYYAMTVSGYAQELINGRYQNVYVPDKNNKSKSVLWQQTSTRYFHTGSLPDHLVDGDIALAYPGYLKLNEPGSGTDVYKNNQLLSSEAEHPQLCMKRSRMDLMTRPGTTMWIRVDEKTSTGWKTVDEDICAENRYTYSDQNGTGEYIRWEAKNRYGHLSYARKAGAQYRLLILRRDEDKFNRHMKDDALTKTTTKDSQGNVANGKAEWSSSQSYMLNNSPSSETVSLTAAMNKMSDAAETDYSRDLTKEQSKEFKAVNIVDDFYEVVYRCDFTILPEYSLTDWCRSIFKSGSQADMDAARDVLNMMHFSNERGFIYTYLGVKDNYFDSYQSFNPDIYEGANTYKVKGNPHVYLSYLSTLYLFPGFYVPGDSYVYPGKVTESIIFNLDGGFKWGSNCIGVTTEQMQKLRLNPYVSPQFQGANSSALRILWNNINMNGFSSNRFRIGIGATYPNGFFELVKAYLAHDALMAEDISSQFIGYLQSYDSGNSSYRKSFAKRWKHEVIHTPNYKLANVSIPIYQVALFNGYHNSYPMQNSLVNGAMRTAYLSRQRDYCDNVVYSGFLRGSLKFNAKDYLKSVKAMKFKVSVPFIYFYKRSGNLEYLHESYTFEYNYPFKNKESNYSLY